MHTILIAILYTEKEPWKSIWENGQNKTWNSLNCENIEVIRYTSSYTPRIIELYDKFHESFRYKKLIGNIQSRFDVIQTKFINRKIPQYRYNIVEKNLLIDCWSTYQLFGRRNLALFDFFMQKTQFDFLYATNVSSYINKQKLFETVQSFNPNENVYAGSLVLKDSPNEFVSGAGKLFSRKLIGNFLSNLTIYPHDTQEDFATGKIARKLGVKALELPMVFLPTPESALNASDESLKSSFHFRCKGTALPRLDAEIMHILHEKVQNGQ